MRSDSLLDQIRKMNLEMESYFYRLMSPKHPLRTASEEKWQPYMDVYETKDALVIKIELAGVERKDISINLYEGRLTVRGIRRDPSPREKRIYHQVEINYREFERVVVLPETVSHEAIKAEYKDGFLTITVAKENVQVTQSILEIKVK